MQDLFRHLHFDPELAVRFLAVFSRMEYALKVSRTAERRMLGLRGVMLVSVIILISITLRNAADL